MASKSKADVRRAVHSRIRKKVQGTTETPRLAVFRSLNHIYAQIIDDQNGKTIAAASTTEKDLGGAKKGGNLEAAQKVGKAIAERAVAVGVSQVVFDRGGYVYHGRVKALLDATREAGLNKNENVGDANTPSVTENSDTVASVDAPAKKSKKSAGDRSQKNVDESEAQNDKVNKESNENE